MLSWKDVSKEQCICPAGTLERIIKSCEIHPQSPKLIPSDWMDKRISGKKEKKKWMNKRKERKCYLLSSITIKKDYHPTFLPLIVFILAILCTYQPLAEKFSHSYLTISRMSLPT